MQGAPIPPSLVAWSDLERKFHQAQRRRYHCALVRGYLDRADISAADFAERPVLKKPLRPKRRAKRERFQVSLLGSVRAQENIMKHNPGAGPQEGPQPHQIEKRPGVL